MSSEERIVFTKENLDNFFKELAKEYRRQNGKAVPAELILIGGASVLINYGFREMTTDIDAIMRSASGMKDAINRVGDRYGLPNGWLNSDFQNTSSYSPKLIQYSNYYKTFSNVLTVRTVSAEYLIAMKLRSGRQYKNDLSDVLGILAEHEKLGQPITMEQITAAAVNLYGEWVQIPQAARDFITDAMNDGRFSELYAEATANEKDVRSALIQFEHKYTGIANETNVNDIINSLLKRKAESRAAEETETSPKKSNRQEDLER